MISALNLIAWLACVVYSTIPCFWLLVHPWAKRWRMIKWSPYLILLPVWMAMWVAVALITFRWHTIAIYSSRGMWIPAVPFFGLGLWLYLQSSQHFSAKQLGGLPELVAGEREQQLVTTGIRAHVRHPVYLAHLCEMLAWSLGTGLAVCLGLTAFGVLSGALMVRAEDKELEERFGEPYRRYKELVPAIIPYKSRHMASARHF